MPACFDKYGGGPRFSGKFKQKGTTTDEGLVNHRSSDPFAGVCEVTIADGGG